MKFELTAGLVTGTRAPSAILNGPKDPDALPSSSNGVQFDTKTVGDLIRALVRFVHVDIFFFFSTTLIPPVAALLLIGEPIAFCELFKT